MGVKTNLFVLKRANDECGNWRKKIGLVDLPFAANVMLLSIRLSKFVEID